MTLDKMSLQCLIRGKTITTFPMIYETDLIYSALKVKLIKIFERDPLVKKYFRFEYAEADTLIIKAVGLRD
jgi:hypothetical protein